MSINYPLTCGFGKVALHKIIASGHSLKKQCEESTVQFNSRLYQFQFNLYHELFSHSNCQIQYQHFKLKEHIVYLGRRKKIVTVNNKY